MEGTQQKGQTSNSPYPQHIMNRYQPMQIPHQQPHYQQHGQQPLQSMPFVVVPGSQFQYQQGMGMPNNRSMDMRDMRFVDHMQPSAPQHAVQRNMQNWIPNNWVVNYVPDSMNYMGRPPYSNVQGSSGRGMPVTYVALNQQQMGMPKSEGGRLILPNGSGQDQNSSGGPPGNQDDKKEQSDESSTTYTEIMSRSPALQPFTNEKYTSTFNNLNDFKEDQKEEIERKPERESRKRAKLDNDEGLPILSLPPSAANRNEEEEKVDRTHKKSSEKERRIVYNGENTFGRKDLKLGNVDVLVHPCYLTTMNEQVINCNIWGTDTYSTNSDIVAILIHTGKFKISHKQPAHALKVTIDLVKSPPIFFPSRRNNIESRYGMKLIDSEVAIQVQRVTESDDKYFDCYGSFLKRSHVESGDRRVHAKGSSIRLSDTGFTSYGYSVETISDRGFSSGMLSSAKLKTHVLILEAKNTVYELYKKNGSISLSELSKNYTHRANFEYPVPEDQKSVVLRGLEWSELVFGVDFVSIRGFTLFIIAFSWKKLQKNDE